MRQSRILIIFLLAFTSIYSSPPIDFFKDSYNVNVVERSENLLRKASHLYGLQNYWETLKVCESTFQNGGVKKTTILKKMALGHDAIIIHTEEAVKYIQTSLRNVFGTTFSLFKRTIGIEKSSEFKAIPNKFAPKFSIWSFMYLYVALIGFYITLMINLNKKTDHISRILISSFIFIHSFFILHICLNITNYQYTFPHSYLMSTSFSFLYGPLLYFYFKRITQQYRFRKIDAVHLIPTVLFLVYIIPIYAMSAEDKLNLMLRRVSNGDNAADSTYVGLIVSLKLISLIVYGYYIRKLYLKSKAHKELSKENKIWQKNIVRIHFSYIISYVIYGALISNNMSSGFFYHSQVICMSIMVVYVGYSANVQYNVFNGIYSFDNKSFFKYEKSGLTESLSHELKENLLHLFDTEKNYKESNISLETLAQKLNTTRHNTSQIINEHFKMSFHELINKYRIEEAKEILQNDQQKNLNIIDVAYEVGYNNKVTFNKAFKKDTKLTPSQYQKISLHV